MDHYLNGIIFKSTLNFCHKTHDPSVHLSRAGVTVVLLVTFITSLLLNMTLSKLSAICL